MLKADLVLEKFGEIVNGSRCDRILGKLRSILPELCQNLFFCASFEQMLTYDCMSEVISKIHKYIGGGIQTLDLEDAVLTLLTARIYQLRIAYAITGAQANW